MAVTYPGRNGAAPTVLFVGAVLETRERNFHDDSDFYALCWDGEKLVTEEYDTTRFAGGGSAFVDATDEVRKLAANWAYNKLRKQVFADYLDTLKKPEKGDEVVVVKGRNVKIGTTGKLFWIGEERTFGGYSRWSQSKVVKVGIATDEERDEKGRYKNVAWTYLTNLEVKDISKKFKYSRIKSYLKGLRRNGNRYLVGMG